MRKILAAALLAALGTAACASDQGSSTGDSRTRDAGPIKVGVVGPMTGLASFVGKNMVEGIQLAIDDINEAGGLLDGRRVEFVMRDDEYDPAKTSTAVRELIEKEEVSALFGPASASTYLAISRIIQDNQIPTWVITAGSDVGSGTNPYAFRAYIPDQAEIDALAEFAAKRYSRIAILAGNDADGQAFTKATQDALRKHGKPAVTAVSFAQDETDYAPIVLKIKQSGADALILGTHLGLFASRAAVAAKNLGLKAQILGLAGLISYTYPDLGREAADGTIFVSFRSWGHLPKAQWPESVRTFYERYVDRYLPDGEFSQTGAYRAYSTNFLTYDMVKIWAHAVEQAQTAEPNRVADVLNGDFTYPASESVIGVPWKYTSTNHDGIEPGDLYFYRWDLQAPGKFKLNFIGTTTDVLSGKVTL